VSENLKYGTCRPTVYDYDFCNSIVQTLLSLLPTPSIFKDIIQMLFMYRFYDYTLVTDADFDFKI